ncbi:MAG: hypothetical protein WDN24_17545 [Sphingomonas sp.]
MGSFVVALVTTYVAGGPDNLWLSMVIVAGTLLPLGAFAIARAMKPYAEEIDRLDRLKVA